METENYVAKLNEYTQRERVELRFEDVGAVGPDHIKTFTLRAVVNGKTYPDGVGKNKKEAKQNAAKNALKGLLEEAADPIVSATETPTSPIQQTSNKYISLLNDYGQKNRVMVKPEETTRPGSYLEAQCCRFVVGDKQYPSAYGKTKKEAKEEAAKLAYQEIYAIKTTDAGDENSCGTPSKQKEDLNKSVAESCDLVRSLSLKTGDSALTETNFIGRINEYCQRSGYAPKFIEEERSGPAHCPQFFYKLVINNKEYPVGKGKNVKEAKHHAAQLAFLDLQNQPEWRSMVFPSSDGTPSKLSTSSSLQDSGHGGSSSMQSNTSDSIVFTNSSKLTKDKTPDVKPKIRIAANFNNACSSSKEDIMPNFKGKVPINSRSQKTLSRFASDYDSIEPLGKGAFGHVFKAQQILLKKLFAVKIVRCKEKALREVQALSDLNHINIVRYYTCWMEDSEYQWESSTDSCSSSQSSCDSAVKYLYIQMELCNTKTLRVWIDEKNIQNVKKSLRDSKRRDKGLDFALQIVTGVEYVHSKVLIHRDLKPANIMFGLNGEVKIGDFGLVTAEKDDAENLQERSGYKGTPSYMAPEQKSRSGNSYDRKVDIFALGLIYFELLWNIGTGHERSVIWDDARNQKLPQGFSQHFHQEHQIIKSMLCAQPQDRPEASRVKADLEECRQSLMCRERNTV
ncbi:interferon-induced, double-stranded RNA-activated protein kinase [Parambassis ranga]|uniref:non-specific serine/threonine protein kinase n=1 Tax=Parambassis ranga TaxID=210632 RepID=A0A6P7JR20_9TELE|nr:interferon-induced, double-stranded RNA-activated protein kinase-like [Parambassis ranga]